MRIYRNGPTTAHKVLVVPGFSESITHNKALVDIVASKGYNTFTFSRPRGGPSRHPLDRQKDIVMSALMATVPENEKVHAVAHSLGSATLLRAAREHPERFASLLLMEPSGIVSIQSLRELVHRASIKTKNNQQAVSRNEPSVTLRQIIRAQLASSVIIARNPILAFKEARVATRHSIADDIVAIMRLNIPIHIVNAYGDELFSIDRAGIGYDQIMTFAGSYSSITDKSAGHDTFWIHPEQTAQLVDTFIKLLDKTQSRD